MQNADTACSFSGRVVDVAHSISHIPILPWCFMTKGVNVWICVSCLNAAMVHKVIHYMAFWLQSCFHVPVGRKIISTPWWHVFTWEWCFQRRGCARRFCCCCCCCSFAWQIRKLSHSIFWPANFKQWQLWFNWIEILFSVINIQWAEQKIYIMRSHIQQINKCNFFSTVTKTTDCGPATIQTMH